MTESEQRLAEAFDALDVDGVLSATRALFDEGVEIVAIDEMLQEGMIRAERKMESGEYFLGDLIVAGMLFVEALMILHDDPVSLLKEKKPSGRVLIGVVNRDIHDIGKDIVVQVLRGRCFEVIDLGVDVPAESFISEVERYRPDVVALSGVMGDSIEEMRRIIEFMDEKGLHEQIPVVIGGSCTSEMVCKRIGADAYAENPIDTADICLEFTRGGGR